jgi:hypothetical protein
MYEILTINGEEFKLRLTTRTSIQLEKALGCNPLDILMEIEGGKIPKMMDMVIILHAMLQSLHHGYTQEKVIDLMDDYIADGHGSLDLLPVFIKVFENSGYIPKTVEETTEDEVKN